MTTHCDDIGRSSAALLAAGVFTFAAGPALSATVIQPDLRAGVSYLDNAGFTGEEEVEATGAEIRARVKFGIVDERGQLTLTPMIRMEEYSEDNVTDREEQRLTLNWFRNFQTAASNTLLEYHRQDLFSSEFRDPTLDPDEIPDFEESGSGVVDVDTNRDRLRARQDFAKSIGLRDNLVFGAEYVDVAYDDSTTTPRVDFDELQLGVGWLRSLSERTDVRVTVGASRYDGEDGRSGDSLGAELGFDIAVSETASLAASAGYERIDREDQFQDLGTDGVFIFHLGGDKRTELTRFRGEVSRSLRPTSIGGVTTETGASFYLDRQLSPRTTFTAGVTAFREEREGGSASDRDYVSGALQLAWQLTREWSLAASVRHTRQDFESPLVLGGVTTEDRTKLLLSIQYRGLQELPLRRDSRFIRGGY